MGTTTQSPKNRGEEPTRGIQSSVELPPLDIQGAVELRLGLLSGQRRLKIFDKLTMQDVTDDKDLCRIYDKSKMQSFSHFLSIGKKRLKIPDYNDQSERILKEALRHYIRNHTPFKKGNADKLKEQISEKKKPKANLAQRHKSKTKGKPQITDNSSKATRDGNTDKSAKIIQVTDDFNNLDIQGTIELRLGLLSGQRHLAIFDQLGMHDLTEDEGLRQTYRESGVNSFSDFLALGKSRLKIPSYNKKSELTLKECLRKYIKNGIQDTLTSNNLGESGAKKMPQTKPKQEKLAAKGNKIYLDQQANDTDELAKDLLYGRRHLKVFDRLQMRDLTDNENLCRIYNKLKILSFSHFLALGLQRMMLPYYDEDAERVLKDILRNFITKLTKKEKLEGSKEIDQLKEVSPPTSEHPSTTTQIPEAENLLKTALETKIVHEKNHVNSNAEITALNSQPDYDQIETFVKDLLTGSSTWQPMDQIEMKDLSTNNGLRYYYELSKCTNLSDFLLLSEKRFDLRGYHKGSESRLEDELIKFFKSEHLTHAILANDIPKNSPQEPPPPPQYQEKADLKLHPLPSAKLSPQPTSLTGITAELKREDRDHFINELMNGSIHWENFNNLEMSDITSDARLCHCYENSGAKSLSTFLGIGTKRLSLRNYGRKSERQLRETLSVYFEHNPVDTAHLSKSTFETAPAPLSIQHEQLIERLKQNKKVTAILNKLECRLLRDEVKGSDLSERLVSSTAAEIGMPWPIGGKSVLAEKRIRDYIDHDIADLMKVDRFGKKKVATYVACIIHLHHKLSSNDVEIDRTLKELMLSAWEKCRLTEKEQDILRLRFGIKKRKHTLEEIAAIYHVTRERIRQMQKKALLKLKLGEGYQEIPKKLCTKKTAIWEKLSQTSRLSKSIDLHQLEQALPFEEHLAIELSVDRKHRSITMPAIADWLDSNFPNDETFWYKEQDVISDKSEHNEKINRGLMDFLEQL